MKSTDHFIAKALHDQSHDCSAFDNSFNFGYHESLQLLRDRSGSKLEIRIQLCSICYT